MFRYVVSRHLLVCTPGKHGLAAPGSEDVRAPVPAALFLRLPIASLVDMQGLSRGRISEPLEPQRLVAVRMGA